DRSAQRAGVRGRHERRPHADRVPAPARARARAGARRHARGADAAHLGPPPPLPRPHCGRLRAEAARQDRPTGATPHLHPHPVRGRIQARAAGEVVPRAPTRARSADRFLNRELSSLDFSARVLELASSGELPLLERVRFCAIFSQQLDDFFQVRVAGLMDQAEAGVALRSWDGRTPKQALGEIRARVLALTERQARIWKRELAPALAAEGVVVGGVEGCTKEELAELATRFEQEIYPVLTPLAVGPGQPFPYISALSLSLVVVVRDPESGEERLARVKVPEGLPRFLEVGGRGLFLPLEEVIAYFLPQLFPQMEIAERAYFRVTRDADFEVS